MTPKCFLAVPHYGDLAPEAFPGLIAPSQDIDVHVLMGGGSLLALVFNRLWCQALNARAKQGYEFFAMHHADVQAPPNWLDVLVREMRRVDADVVSTVIPIKDRRGLTSTGVRNQNTGHIRRLTMKETLSLPITFTAKDVCRDDEWLMLNTGLWVCDFTKPWVEEVCFSILDSVVKEDGIFKPRTLPEDWNFSGWCARKGVKTAATRALQVSHYGRVGFTNDRVWGEWETDLGDNAA